VTDPFRQPGRWIAGPDGTEFKPIRRMPPPRQRSNSFFAGRRPAQATLADPEIGLATTALPPGSSGQSSSLATILGSNSTRWVWLVGGAIGASLLLALGLLSSNHVRPSSNRTGSSLQSRGASTLPIPQATAPEPTSTFPMTTKPRTLAPVPPGRSSVATPMVPPAAALVKSPAKGAKRLKPHSGIKKSKPNHPPKELVHPKLHHL